MNDDQVEIAAQWQNEVMTLSKQITAAQMEYSDASKVRLERRHKLEELQDNLRRLCDRGPFGSDSDQPTLFDVEQKDDDSVRQVKVPKRIINLLEQAGISTLSRLRDVIDGVDDGFPEGLESIPGMDVDASKRLLSEFDDAAAEAEHPASVPYTIPVAASVDAMPKVTAPKGVMIRTKVELPGVETGESLQATIMPTGQAVVSVETEDGPEDALLEVGEFELATA